MIRSVALVEPGDSSVAAGRDHAARLDIIRRCVSLAPGPGLLVFPLGFLVTDSFAGLAALRRELDSLMVSRHPTLVVGIEARDEQDVWLDPPPGPLGRWDAAVDPWVSSFAAVRHRKKGWLWQSARLRALRADQRIEVGSSEARVRWIDGERVALVLGAEADVFAAPDADITLTMSPVCSGCSGDLEPIAPASVAQGDATVLRLRKRS